MNVYIYVDMYLYFIYRMFYNIFKTPSIALYVHSKTAQLYRITYSCRTIPTIIITKKYTELYNEIAETKFKRK